MKKEEMKDFTKRIVDIDEYTRVSVVEWRTGGHSVETHFSTYAIRHKRWEKENYDVLDMREIGSSQDVYAYLQAVRSGHIPTDTQVI